MRTAADIMRRDPATVDPDMTLREAIDVLRGAGVSGAPVVRGGRLVGVLSATDLLEFEATTPGVPPERGELPDWPEEDMAAEEEDRTEDASAFFFGRWENSEGAVWNRIAGADTPEWDRLEQHTVEEIMSRDLVTVPSDAPLDEAARRMLEREVHRVLAVDGDDLVGILSAFDLVKLVAERAV